MKTASICRVYLQLAVFVLPWLIAAPVFADTGDPPARVARLGNLKGTVSLQPSGATDWSQGTQNATVTTGDRIYTDRGSRAELDVGPFAVRLSEATDLTMANLNDQIMQLGLAQGTIRVRVYQLPSGNTVEIDTPNGALTLQGAGDYRVDTNPNDGSTLVTVNGGSLEVSGGDVSQTVGSGQAVKLTGTNPIQISNVSQPRPDGFDQWSADRDRRVTASVSARYVSREMPGYEDLDNSGRWQDDSQNGPVWYPSGVASDWVPYRNGRWAWVEPWGWTWVEDEPWGFAPFHYGRWAYVGSSWGWLPGPFDARPYYCPALVAFVGGPGFSIGLSFGGGGGIQAWFPLGPGEPFFPWYHYGDNYLRQVNVTNLRNVTNITNITNITNVNNINYANRQVATTAVPTTVFNSGQAVRQRAVKVTSEQLAKAQIIPHPVTSPTIRAVTGGRPAPIPPSVARRATSRANQPQPLITRNTPSGKSVPAGAQRTSLPPPTQNNASGGRSVAAGAQRTPPPLITKNTPPRNSAASSPPRTSLPPPTRNNAPTARSVPAAAERTPPPLITKNTPPEKSAASGPPRTSLPPLARNNAPAARSVPAGAQRTSPPLITKNPPPPRNVPFPTRQKAMSTHPGRPLEPQQVQNLQAGKPAGSMRDKEFPPHPAPVARATPAPPRAAPPSRAATSPGRPPATQKAESKKPTGPGAEPRQ